MTPRAADILALVRARPGVYTPAELARANAWDARDTAMEAAGLEAAGYLLPRPPGALRPRRPVTGISYREVHVNQQEARTVLMAIADGHTDVDAAARRSGLTQRQVRSAWEVLVATGWGWRLGTLVPR